jgi:hypothetical protein
MVITIPVSSLPGVVTDGVLTRQGEFLPLAAPDAAAVMQVFRRLLLARLHHFERSGLEDVRIEMKPLQ